MTMRVVVAVVAITCFSLCIRTTKAAPSGTLCYDLDLKRTERLAANRYDNVEEDFHELKYHLLNPFGELILSSNQMSSQVCIEEDENDCKFLFISGNGAYNVTENGNVIGGGEVFIDDPKLLQIGGDCRHYCINNDLQLVFVGQAEDEPVLYDGDNKPVESLHHTITDEEEGREEKVEEEVVMRMMCIRQSECYTLVGSALYTVSTSAMFIEETGSSYHGFATFGNRSNCHAQCNDKPLLAETNRGQDIVLIASTISGMEVFKDVHSPQYRAACWLIYDDVRQLMSSDYNLLQRYIIALLFYTLRGWEWERNVDFLSPKHECQWHKWVFHVREDVGEFYSDGIHCDDDKGYISRIALPSNNMVGTIPTEFFFLNQVIYLGFYDNLILGSIPSEISLLSNLQHFDFQSNALTGNIPESMFEILSLVTIRAAANMLTGTVPSTIQGGSVTELSFYSNMLSGTIPNEIVLLTSLTRLWLSDNELTGTIPEDIGNLSLLEQFRLWRNKLTGKIPSATLALPNLVELVLNYNSLTGSIPSYVAKNSPLFELFLESNRLSGSIPTELALLTNLDALWLDNNAFSGEIPPIFTNLTSLTDFSIHNNNVTGSILFENCSSAPGDLHADCDTPQKVVCPCCSSCYGIFSSSNDELPCSSGTMMLTFDNLNPGDLIFYFLGSLGGFETWEIASADTTSHTFTRCLSMADCYGLYIENAMYKTWKMNLTIDGNLVLDANITDYESGYRFGFSSNGSVAEGACDDFELCGIIADEESPKRVLFDKLTRITGIQVFYDTSSAHYKAACGWVNFLDGKDNDDQLSSDMLQYFYLAVLYFETNGEEWYNSTGWIGNASFCYWYGIECDEYGVVRVLQLPSNNLRGEIPTIIAELRGLEHLVLNHNYLSGNIPMEIGMKLERLIQFKVMNNSLVGSLPSQIGGFKGIVEIDLSFNQLTNEIPSEVGALENVEVLNLFNNTFSGALPDTFFGLTGLRVLDLGSNLFAGNAEKINSFLNLELLILSNNFFTGNIPLGEYQKNLRVLQLSGNLFGGSIPRSINELKSLEILFLYNNRLTGNLPSQIGNLEKLVSVSLSHNDIRGFIPSAIGKLKNLNLLHLHSNKIEGSGDFFDYAIHDYVTDCGNTFTGAARVQCANCSSCCNLYGDCISMDVIWPGRIIQVSGIPSSAVVFLLILFCCSFHVFCVSVFQSFHRVQTDFQFCREFQDLSVYKFFLTDSIGAKLVAAATVSVQLIFLSIFLSASDFTASKNDWEYSMSCPNEGVDCDDSRFITPLAWFAFSCVLFCYLAKDLLEGLKMIYQSLLLKSRKKGVLAGFVVLYVTVSTIVVSALYNRTTGVSNTDILKDAVILLFLNDFDEKLYSFIEVLRPIWVDSLNEAIQSHLCKHTLRQTKSSHWNINDEELVRQLPGTSTRAAVSTSAICNGYWREMNGTEQEPNNNYMPGNQDEEEQQNSGLEDIHLDMNEGTNTGDAHDQLEDTVNGTQVEQEQNDEIRELRADLAKLEKAYTELEETHTGLEKAHTILEKAHTKLEKAHTNLERAHTDLENAHKGLENVCSNLTKEVYDLKKIMIQHNTR